MFGYLEYDSDRTRVRNKFINEINKKTTLKDIGRLLDKFMLDEEGEMLRFKDYRKDEKVRTAS